MKWRERITSDPEMAHGAPCFKGTRIPVSVVLDNLAADCSWKEILESYPSLRAEHIRAALAYAADLSRERVIPLPTAES